MSLTVTTTLANPLRRLPAIFLFVCLPAAGCTTTTGGQDLPSYPPDPDVVYLDPGPHFPMGGETATPKPPESEVKDRRAAQP